MRAVILAGGKGTRLAPYTTVLPKPLMPIGDMPILEVVLRQLRAAGIDRVTMAVGHLAELLRAFFGGGERLGLQIDYSLEEEPLGTVGPLNAIAGLDQTFLMMNGDVLTTLDYGALVAQHQASGGLMSIATYRRTVKVDFGVIETDSSNALVGYSEKPTLDYQVSMGIYVMEPGVLPYVARHKRLDLPDLVRMLITDGRTVMAYPFAGYWLDIGRPDDYARAIEEFESRRDQFLQE
jgi:NDP-sugar pyrophosphorylase family protein